MQGMHLVRPGPEHIGSYVSALTRSWSPNNLSLATAQKELREIERSSAAFLATLDDPEGTGPPIEFDDGTTAPRLPGFRRWMWDGEFCGSIGLRWQPGAAALPPSCLGHIGYAVVPWKRRRGYATAALAAMLPEARSVGLPYVELTTEPDNLASQRVILANGGTLVERFTASRQHGGGELLRFRILLWAQAPTEATGK